MHVFELNRRENLSEADFPMHSAQLKLNLVMDFGGVHVPPPAARRLTLAWLRRILSETEEEDLMALSSAEQDAIVAKAQEPAVRVGTATHTVGAGHAASWIQPAGLDLRVVKSAHRIILEVAKRGESGRAVLASELVGAMGLSAPTVGRLLRPGEPGSDYLAQFIRVSPEGRTKAIDLTNEGRLLASKIRAGVVPA